MKEHNKLVRDRIPEIIESNGAIAHTNYLESDQEYVMALANKLVEEAEEVKQTPTLEELADVKEVLEALIIAMGYTVNEVEVMQNKKAATNGKFEKRIYLTHTEER